MIGMVFGSVGYAILAVACVAHLRFGLDVVGGTCRLRPLIAKPMPAPAIVEEVTCSIAAFLPSADCAGARYTQVSETKRAGRKGSTDTPGSPSVTPANVSARSHSDEACSTRASGVMIRIRRLSTESVTMSGEVGFTGSQQQNFIRENSMRSKLMLSLAASVSGDAVPSTNCKRFGRRARRR